MLKSPHARVVARALLAGLITFATLVNQADDPFSTAVLQAAAISALWVVVENITPLNALVGWFKKPV